MLPLLVGIRVVDLTRHYALTSSRLADLGADVVKVEAPPIGDHLRALPPFVPSAQASMAFLMLNRNKRSLGLDLRSDGGREVMRRLVANADVFVENATPGVLARSGLDYATLRALKPDLVYCSVTAYGQDGPYAPLPAHSMNVDAAAGELRISRGPGGRPEIAAYSQIGHGMELAGIEGALAVAAALVRRERTGEGCHLDVAGWDAAVGANQRFFAALNLGSASAAIGAAGEGGLGARTNVYGTKDDRVVLLCPLEKHLWQRFCEVAGRPEWVDRGEWAGAMDFGEDEQLRADVEAVIRTRNLADWMADFVRAGVPAAPVADPDELPADPHVEARRMVATAAGEAMRDVRFVRPPVRVSDAEFGVAVAPPRFGEHTDQVLAELGYDDAQRADLLATGATYAPPPDGGTP